MRVVIYDACVLFSTPLRDLMIRLAIKGVLRARWTEDILDEVFRSIQRHRPDLPVAALERTRQMMNSAVRDCLIHSHREMIPELSLPDPDDRHVLAAAICAGASMIVTFNLRDFPVSSLAIHGVVAVHPDLLMLELLEQSDGAVLRTLFEQAGALKNPTRTVEDLIGTLEGCGLARSMAKVRGIIGS